SNLLKIGKESNISKTIIVSSNSPIGCNPFQDHLFDEESPYNPYMNYGKSKMLMEQESLSFSKTHNQNIVIIRTPWFYGVNQPSRQTLFFQMIKNGRFPFVGSGNNKRSMSYLDNLCQG